MTSPLSSVIPCYWSLLPWSSSAQSAVSLSSISEVQDEWKTAFSTNTGLTNSPSIFQAFINDVFCNMLNKCVIVYIEDILIYSDLLNFPDHVRQVRAVLQRLIDHQLYVKLEKCEFHKTSTSFLGYIISAEGVAMDDSKVKAVVNWPLPTTIKELQRFLGFANFY